MDEYGGHRFESIGNSVKKKRSRTSRRPRPESQPFQESHDQSPLSTPPSDDMSKGSGDENDSYGANPSRKVFNLNQCVSRGSSINQSEGEYPLMKSNEDGGFIELYSSGGSGDGTDQGCSASSDEQLVQGLDGGSRLSVMALDGVENEKKLKKVKLKVGGVIRTIQTKAGSNGASGSGSSMKSFQSSNVPRSRQKLILEDDSEEDPSPPPPDKNISLQGIPWKDFSKRGFGLGKEESSMGKIPDKNTSVNQGEKSDPVRKSKRASKKRVLDGDFEEDDEIRYLEKLRTSKVAVGYKDFEEESSKKQKSLSRISKVVKYDNIEDHGPHMSGKGAKRSKSERALEDTDYEDEEEISGCEHEGKQKKKQNKDSSNSPPESWREMTLTTRQRALLSSKDSTSASVSQIEFPNGLPPPMSRKQKEKLTDVEQQLKKAEAAQRRRMQNEKAARESEAEAIRKILGQDSSRKKREEKIRKRQEELAHEKAASAQMLASNTVRWVMGPTGTVVTFHKDMGLPHIFDPKPCSYPAPREKCARPSCSNPYKYRDSKSNLPVCSLQCYKAIHEKILAEPAC